MSQTTLSQSPVIVQTFMGAIYSSQYYAADTGGVNAISIPLAIAPNAYAEGVIWFTKFANTNTSSTVTAKIGSLAALPVVIDQAGTLPVIGSIISGMFGMLCYSSAQNKLILLNPQTSIGSFNLTLATGLTTTPSGTVNYRISPDGKNALVYVVSAITGTSNATTMTGTGIPAVLVGVTNLAVGVQSLDAGANQWGYLVGTNGTTWTFGKVYGSVGGYTGSGTKGISSGTLAVPYLLV